MKKFAVILCGCGHADGSEIHEAVMTLLAISNHNCKYTVFAPDDNQLHVINHLTKEVVNESRNMMVEAARIARGAVEDINHYDPASFDGLIIPGGFGVAKNLISYAIDGEIAKVRPDVEKAVKDTFAIHKPIGALCIAPVLLAKVLENITVTVGCDSKTIQDIACFGAKHVNTIEGEVVVDKENLIFSTPCYMLDASISDIAKSANKLIGSILESIE